MFLQAGSPARAADVFRGILHDAPANADAYAGLGEAEFARGNYRAAQQDFQAALRLAPNTRPQSNGSTLCNELLMLDPTMRGLGPMERFRRSRQAGRADGGRNQSMHRSQSSPDIAGIARQGGERAESSREPASAKAEVSESNLDLAEQLWQVRKKECKSPLAVDTPLALVQARLAQ